MELRHLQTFRAVASAGSFTRAAQALGYAQSSVTAHIQTLEFDLGAALFDRLGNHIALTPAGQRLLGYAVEVARLTEEARLAISAPTSGGSLVISAPDTFSTYRLPPLLRTFRSQEPATQLQLRPSYNEELPHLLRDGTLDVAFLLDAPQRFSGITTEFLGAEPIMLVGPPGHALAQAAFDPAALAAEPLLLTEPGCGYRVVFERWLSSRGVVPRETLEFVSVGAMKECVLLGMGLAVLPHMAVAHELACGTMVALPWPTPLTVQVQMLTLAERSPAPALAAFAQLARLVLGRLAEAPA